MKSNKQRRAEIMARRAIKRLGPPPPIIKHSPPHGSTFVNVSQLAPNNSCGYFYRDFVERGYYLPVAFTCKDCGVAEVWSTASQKWWYEEMKGDIFTTAIRCRPCRATERTRKMLAREVSLAGRMMKLKQKESKAKNGNINH